MSDDKKVYQVQGVSNGDFEVDNQIYDDISLAKIRCKELQTKCKYLYFEVIELKYIES